MDNKDFQLFAEENKHLLKGIETAIQANSFKGFRPMGQFDKAKSYFAYDVVYQDGRGYIALRSGKLDLTNPEHVVLFVDKGEKGERGFEGPQGDTGPQGPQGIRGFSGDKGEKGDDGKAGPQGPRGETGPQGPQGPQGKKGDDGLSAYQVWLKEGNKGSEKDFLNSLKTKGQVVQNITAGSGGPITTINHGTNANYQRPTHSFPITWVGSVEPLNALDNDIWVDTS